VRPRGVLIDFGGTLFEELGYDPRAGAEALLARAAPSDVDRGRVMARMRVVADTVAARRQEAQLEAPFPLITRLVYDVLGVQFAEAMPVLERAFWTASTTIRPMPGVAEALATLRRAGASLGVVSNTMFAAETLRFALGEHGLAELFTCVVVSAEYAARKPNPALFEVAAALLRIPPEDIWFVGDALENDVAGARAAGMTPVWFRGAGRPGAAQPALEVSSWTELVDAFLAA
jgi:HAD superfamily hydrolase (TIGR01662 family)